MAKADDGTSTARIPLGAAKALLVKNFQAPQRLLIELAAGRMPVWDESGNPLGPGDWQFNFEESTARAMIGVSPSGAPNYGPIHYGVAVSCAAVVALLPKDAIEHEEADGADEDEKVGWQVSRVLSVLPKLYPPDGKVPDNVPIATVQERVGQELAADSKNRGVKPPSWDAVKSALGRGK